MQAHVPSPSDHQAFEELIDSLLSQGYGVGDGLFSPDLIEGLRGQAQALLAQDQLRPAGLGPSGDSQRDRSIRSDLIRWIEPDSDHPFERACCAQIEAFIAYLNRTCYAGIDGYELHYACYPPGSFYQRHRDQFRRDLGRQFSLVTYLNDEWQAQDGGALVLYLPDRALSLLPQAGRTVFFRSDELDHEVEVAHRTRLSVTGWLKRS